MLRTGGLPTTRTLLASRSPPGGKAEKCLGAGKINILLFNTFTLLLGSAMVSPKPAGRLLAAKQSFFARGSEVVSPHHASYTGAGRMPSSKAQRTAMS